MRCLHVGHCFPLGSPQLVLSLLQIIRTLRMPFSIPPSCPLSSVPLSLWPLLPLLMRHSRLRAHLSRLLHCTFSAESWSHLAGSPPPPLSSFPSSPFRLLVSAFQSSDILSSYQRRSACQSRVLRTLVVSWLFISPALTRARTATAARANCGFRCCTW